jgi:signal transduction histidine kinase
MLERNMGRISDLVLDLLEYSRDREPEYENCLPNEIVNEVCQLMEPRAKEHDVEIVKELDPSLGEMSLDPKGIHRCLLNLVSNGVDACLFDSSEGKRWAVQVKTILEHDGTLRFDVSDNGCGMDEEVRSKLFTTFFSTKEGRGTGLGLLIVQKIVQDHAGTITVKSQPGKGSTFTMLLPHRDAAPQDAGAGELHES